MICAPAPEKQFVTVRTAGMAFHGELVDMDHEVVVVRTPLAEKRILRSAVVGMALLDNDPNKKK